MKLNDLSIRNKLIFGFIIPVFLVLVGITVWNIVSNRSDAIQNAIEESKRVLLQNESSIRGFFNEKEMILKTLRQTNAVRQFLIEDTIFSIRGVHRPGNETTHYRSAKQTVTNLTIADSTLISAYMMVEGTKDYVDNTDWASPDNYRIDRRDWYKALTEATGAYLQPIIFDELGIKRYVIPMRMPMYEGDRFLGGIGVDFSIEQLTDIITAINADDLNQVLIVHKEDQIIYHSQVRLVIEETDSLTASFMHRKIKTVNQLLDLPVDDPFKAVVNQLDTMLQGTQLTNQVAQFTLDYKGDTYYYFVKMIDGIDWIVGYYVSERELMEPVIAQTMQDVFLLMILTIIGVVVTILMNRSISRPMEKLVALMQQMARGDADLTRRFKYEREDEIGQLGRYFDQFIEKQQSLMRLILENSRGVATDSQFVGNEAKRTDDMFRSLQESANNAVTATKELATSITEVVSNANESTKNIKDSEDIISTSSKEISRVLIQFSQITEDLKKTGVDIQKLKTEYQDVMKISAEIGDLADRLNILSVNAKIEALKLTGQDHGFEIVASEMTDLAENTTESVSTIHRITADLESRIVTISGRIDEYNSKLAQFQTEVLNSLENLNQIQRYVKIAVSMIEQIAVASTQQSHVSDEINRYINELVAVIRRVSEQVQVSIERTDKMKESSEVLLDNVTTFRIE